jgi:hypothetical protein
MSSKEEGKELVPEPCRNLAGIQAIAKKQGQELDKATVAFTLGYAAGEVSSKIPLDIYLLRSIC